MVQAGEDFVLNVNTGTSGAPVWTPVADMNSYGKTKARTRNRFPVFGGTVHTTTSPAEEDYAVGGFLNDDDPGQQALRDAADNGDVVEIQVLFDGTNGFMQPVKVGTYTHDADPEGLQEHGFEFSGSGVATVVGTGPIL